MTTNRVQRPVTLAPEEAAEPPKETPEATPMAEKPVDEYEFHIRLHGPDIDQKLKDATTVAYRLGLITKPTLAQLMNLFIVWGLALLKERWLERVGYR